MKAEDEPNKGIGNSTTLKEDLCDLPSAYQVLLALSETVASRLRKANMKCNCIQIEMKDSDFIVHTHQTTLNTATNSTNQIYEAACRLLKETWVQKPLRLLGLRTSKLDDNDYSQLSLFQASEDNKIKKIDKAIDQIRDKFGQDSIKRASFLSEDAVCNHKLGK